MPEANQRAPRGAPGPASWFRLLLAGLLLCAGYVAVLGAFLVLDALLLRPLPHPDPDRLVALAWRSPSGLEDSSPLAILDDFAQEAEGLEALGAYRPLGEAALELPEGGASRPVRAWQVTHDLLPLLGAVPALGEGFTRIQEDLGTPVVLLAHPLWKEAFAGDPEVLGRTLQLDGQARMVVGVLPPDLVLPGNARVDVFVPLDRLREPVDYASATHHALGRSSPGLDPGTLQARLQAVVDRRGTVDPAAARLPRLEVRGLRRALLGDEAPLALATLGVAALLALITCAHLARRASPLAPTSLGERLLWIAPILLAALGLAWGLAPRLPALLPAFQAAPGMDAPGATLRLLPAGLLLAALSAWAWQPLGPPRGARLVAPSAAAVLMLVFAGLFLRGFTRALGADPGFDPRGLVALRIRLPEPRYSPEAAADLQLELLRGLQGLPELESAALSTADLPGGEYAQGHLEDGQRVRLEGVGPGHFEAMRATLLRGRGIQEGDGPVAVVNEALARARFPGQNPLGRPLVLRGPALGGPGAANVRIVGVFRDLRRPGASGPAEPLACLPLARCRARTFTLYLRGTLPARELQRLVAARLLERDPYLHPEPPLSLEASARTGLAGLRQTAILAGASAALALLLAALGIRAVAVRALAHRGGPTGPVIRQVLLQALVGAALGTGSALLLGRLLGRQLQGLPVFDPGTLLAAVALFGCTGALAALFPAVRAAREEARRRAREAQWVQLKGQLNPHVFFNAMNNLTALIRKDPVLAEKAAEDLTALFRRLMSHGHKPVAPLAEERALLESYLAVEGLRFGPRMTLKWDWDPALDDVMAPPFLLQPLVENALKHGLGPCPAGGELGIVGRREGGRVVLRVENTGQPLGERRPGGLGLENLEARLRLFFPRGSRFRLGQEEGRTVAELEFPTFEELT